MKGILRMVGVAWLGLYLSSSNAAWTGPGVLGELAIHSDAGGDAVRITHTNMKNPANCSSGAYLELRASTPAFQEMYSLLLSAKTADRMVDVYVSDTQCSTGGNPLITQVSYNQVAGSGLVDALPTATSAKDGLMSAQDKAKLDSLPDGPLVLGSQVAVLTGSVADGGTIPLPPGYTESQCKWRVMLTEVPYFPACDSLSGSPLKVSMSGRVVSAKKYEHTSVGCITAGVSVDYLMMCVK